MSSRASSDPTPAQAQPPDQAGRGLRANALHDRVDEELAGPPAE